MRLRGGSTVLSVGLTVFLLAKAIGQFITTCFRRYQRGVQLYTPTAYLSSYSAKRQLAFTPNLAFLATKLALLRQDFQEVPLLV